MPGAGALPSTGEGPNDAAGCSSCHICGVSEAEPGPSGSSSDPLAGRAILPWPEPPRLRVQGRSLLDGISETLPTLETWQREFSPAAAAAWTGRSFLGPRSGRVLCISIQLTSDWLQPLPG